jgi:hypothetical protein
MSAIMKSAMGASTFTQTDYELVRPITSQVAPPNMVAIQQWGELIDELLRIRKFEDNWDGEGCEAPHSSIVDGAIKLAQVFQSKEFIPANRVIAGVNGTVFFEWHVPLGYLELEVFSSDEAESRWVPKGSDSIEVDRISIYS